MAQRIPTVYAFMDESGDAGMNLRVGSSPHFVIVLVETVEPDALREGLQNLRAQLNLSNGFEFRYHDTRMPWARAAFFNLFHTLTVRVRAVVVNKRRLPPEAQKWGKQDLYKYALGELITHSAFGELQDAVLVMDGERQGSAEPFMRELRQHIAQIARSQGRERIFKRMVLKEAAREDGLQYADMVAGAIAESIKHGESAYDDVIAERTVLLLRLPEK